VKSPPAIGPVIAYLLGLHFDESRACRGAEVGQRGKLADWSVHGVLDDAVSYRNLLDAARRQLEQLGEDDLSQLALNSNREADQGLTRRTRA
jgi:hypothetical protein